MNESFASLYVVAAIGILIPLVFTLFIVWTVPRSRERSKGLIHTINEFLGGLHKHFEQGQK